MEVIKVDPRDCTKWKYADRSFFEYGDPNILAEDIQRNGQIEPVSIRPLKGDGDFKYEVIAGNRRFQACLASSIMMKAIIRDVSDYEAAIIQIKENEKVALSDYSRGISFAKLKEDQKLTQDQLSDITGYSRSKIQNFLAFAKIDQAIWNAVSNISKVSARSAETIYTIAKRGDVYKKALIEIADEIRKGAGSHRIEKLVDQIVLGEDKKIDEHVVKSQSGQVLAIWKNNKLEFSKNLDIDQQQLSNYIAKYFKS
jgi:ParB family transcriptional regulator, chromosome partitioning protein